MRVFLWALAVVYAGAVLAVDSESAFTFESFVHSLQEKRATSVEAALAEVPASFWEHYVLVRDSHSRQGASPAFPRVVLHGMDAHLVIAFNGDPNLSGYDTLEILQYRDDSRRYEFREIQFPTAANHLSAPSVSPANPRQCQFCHRPSLRPNWAAYRNWPGTYGSIDDTLTGDERRDYLSFVQRSPSLERYRRLGRHGDPQIGPYSPARFGKLDERPNLYFTKLLARRHARTLAHRILTQSHDALTAGLAMLGCSGGDSGALPLNLLQSVGIEVADWDLTFVEDGAAKSSYSFFDGLFRLEELVRYAIAAELAEKYPDTLGSFRESPYEYSGAHLTDTVRAMLDTINGLGGGLSTSGNRLCQALRGHLPTRPGR